MSSEAKVWFVTGSSSGFGLCITEYALKKGDKVVATLRKPEVLSELATKHPERLLVLRLDVTEPAEVWSREVEGTTDDTARSVFEANFWGASHVSKEAVRFFREENKPMGGRLLQVSSVGGIHSMAGIGYYCASKFALEALSECLAEELDPNWNIKITILEPGPFRTKCPTVNRKADPVHPAYTDPSLPTMVVRSAFEDPDPAFNGDPDKFAEAVYETAYLEHPPLRLPIHINSLVAMRTRGKQLLETADKWESWSEVVLLKD